ncbi:MAG: hypothetical protein IJJ75_07400 [Firmicutes bacterium]|nr:hypothetical protein [Bacillota bacterium]
MLTQEKYDKIIQTVEDIASSRAADFFEEPPDPAEAARKAFDAAGWPGIDIKTANGIFNFMTGMTFKQYLDSRIMMYAYKCAIEQEHFDSSPLINIAGVSSDSALYKKFKKDFGMSPKEAFEAKDPGLYKAPIFWDSLSAAKQSGFEKASSEKEIKLVHIETVKEIYRTDKRPYRIIAAVLALMIAAGAIAFRLLILSPWKDTYIAFDLLTEEGVSTSRLKRDEIYAIDPYKRTLTVSDPSGSLLFKTRIRLKGNSISWTDEEKSAVSGTLYSDSSIICRITDQSGASEQQLRLVPAVLFKELMDSWDGYYEVFECKDDIYASMAYSIQIDVRTSIIIMGAILEDPVYVGNIIYCGPEHLIFSMPELVPDGFLQCNLTGLDSFTVTMLNSDEILYKCFRMSN